MTRLTSICSEFPVLTECLQWPGSGLGPYIYEMGAVVDPHFTDGDTGAQAWGSAGWLGLVYTGLPGEQLPGCCVHHITESSGTCGQNPVL